MQVEEEIALSSSIMPILSLPMRIQFSSSTFPQKVFYWTLTVPNMTKITNITWAGQTICQNGDLEEEQEMSTIDCKARCLINVPRLGTILIWLDSEAKLFMGNLTIASYQYLLNEMKGLMLSDMTT